MSRPSALAQRGTAAVEDGAGIDFAALRAARRERVFAAMEAAGVDVLMLGRGGNARYVTGHRPIWRSVVTSWAPMCTVVLSTRQVHLLATTWDDGIPAEVPHDNLMQLMWNPRKIFGAIGSIPGLSDATCIGVDGMSTGMGQAIAMLAPSARLVDGERILRVVRGVKLPAEVDCIRIAVSMTEGALVAARDELRPGIRELDLKARFHEALCRYGVNHPAMEGTFCATPRTHANGDAVPPVRLLPDDRALAAGDLVAMTGSVPYAGYEGVVARTWPCTGPSGTPSDAQRSLWERWAEAHDAVVARCLPGATLAELERAWLDAGERRNQLPIVQGVGLGVEQPVVGTADGPAPPDDRLVAGMVLGVQGYVWQGGIGGYLGGETVHVTDAGPERLTRLSHDPLSER